MCIRDRSEPASFGITEQLKSMGFSADRMKTGTPARIDGRSIDFSKMNEQEGENDFHKFSFLDTVHRELKQMSCWITYTNEQTHEILKSGLESSPLYNGQIQSIGPRYCPSIETKVITFAEKLSHKLFLEPEGDVYNRQIQRGTKYILVCIYRLDLVCNQLSD